ncbi:MAG: NADH-quinone oxidoreductase subunit L [bacterium]|nr:NADH-quinone oxidoreductase subunit L [bacterium]
MPTAAPVLALMPLFPLLGALVLGVGGARLQARAGAGAVGALGCAGVWAAFGVGAAAVWTLAGLPASERLLLAEGPTWIDVGGLRVPFTLALDPLSAVLVLLVGGVGGLIHVYAIGYMRDDPAAWRFFAYLNLFTAAMLVLVLADNLLLLFLGWEGVGFCSWALVGFWWEDRANAAAGTRAFLVNRAGDVGVLLGTALLVASLAAAGPPTLTFRELGPLVGGLAPEVVTTVTLLLFLGAAGKSAQIPLHVWLPDAMAGPTPGSALIHAATMVTAGVYLLARLHPLFAPALVTAHVVAGVGAVTALWGAVLAASQHDVKKVLAYSTVSQLGYMMLAMGVGAAAAGVFHLTTHAFFKAALFLAAGSVIHALGGEQDMRRMGGLRRALPHTCAVYVVATLALTGVPFVGGFFSKDAILWEAFAGERGHAGLWLVATAVAGLTAYYMVRQLLLVFAGASRLEPAAARIHESPPVMMLPLWVLAAGALGVGWLGVPPALGDVLGVPHLFGAWLAPVLGTPVAEPHPARGVELALMGVSVAVAAAGMLVAWWRFGRGAPPATGAAATDPLDALYARAVVPAVLAAAAGAARFDRTVLDGVVDGTAALVRGLAGASGWLDRVVVDGAVDGVATLTRRLGDRARALQTGAISTYLFVVALGVLGGVVLWWTWTWTTAS